MSNLNDRVCALCSASENQARVIPGYSTKSTTMCFFCWGPVVIESCYVPIPAKLLFGDVDQKYAHVEKTWVDNYDRKWTR